MDQRQPLPRSGSVFPDVRCDDRSLRVSWHDESRVVFSLWRHNVCVGTFRLGADEVPDLVATLRDGLDQAYDAARNRVERMDHLNRPAS